VFQRAVIALRLSAKRRQETQIPFAHDLIDSVTRRAADRTQNTQLCDKEREAIRQGVEVQPRSLVLRPGGSGDAAARTQEKPIPRGLESPRHDKKRRRLAARLKWLPKSRFGRWKLPQGLKPLFYFQHVTARLKSCPDTNQWRDSSSFHRLRREQQILRRLIPLCGTG